jgi:WhiB family redox-sensing transcriptional regulator
VPPNETKPALASQAFFWGEQGPCQTDPEAFFPERGGSNQDAKRMCRQVCKLREACLQYALDTRVQYGIQGGFTAREQVLIRKLGYNAKQAIEHQETIVR